MNNHYRRSYRAPAASQIMFHATPIENEFSILRDGLLISKAKTGSGVYLTNIKPEPKDGFTALKVDITGLALQEDCTGQPTREGELWFVSPIDIGTFRIRTACKMELYQRTSEIQQQLNLRYPVFKRALLDAGFIYNWQDDHFYRGDTIVWHHAGHPHTQFQLDNLFPYSRWCSKAPGIVWRQVEDTLERTQEAVLADLMANIAEMSHARTDAAVVA